MSNFKTSLAKNLKPYARHIPDINKATMRALLKREKTKNYSKLFSDLFLLLFLVCDACLDHKRFSKEAYDKEIAKISAQNHNGPKDYAIYCTIIMITLETFLKSKKAGEELVEALRDAKFQDECVEDLAKALIGNHQSLSEHFQEMKLVKPLRKFEYRINISLVEW